MNSIRLCGDDSDATVLYRPNNLYLKPVSRISISVHLPALSNHSKSISNYEIIEKIKTLVKPHRFMDIKVEKSTLKCVKFEAVLENKNQVTSVLHSLHHCTLKLSGLSDLLRIKAHSLKVTFPTRHDWDTFFQDAKDMDEKKPGERPDTVHITMLPCSWFTTGNANGTSSTVVKPDEKVIRSVFETFGIIRAIDIPVLDNCHYKSKSVSANTFTFNRDGLFDVFIQYQEYIGFVNCMTAFKGMNLMLKESNTTWAANIHVDFDRTKHMNEESIKRRMERKHKFLELIEKEATIEHPMDMSTNKRMLEAEEDEEDNKETNSQEKQMRESIERSIAIEERKLLLAQRKLESIRLMEYLLERVKVCVENQEAHSAQESGKSNKGKTKRKKQDRESKRFRKLEHKEKKLRAKLVLKYKEVEEQRLEHQKEKLRQTVEGSTTKLKSVVALAKVKPENTSYNSLNESLESLSLSELSDVPEELPRHSSETIRTEGTCKPRENDCSWRSGNRTRELKPSSARRNVNSDSETAPIRYRDNVSQDRSNNFRYTREHTRKQNRSDMQNYRGRQRFEWNRNQKQKNYSRSESPSRSESHSSNHSRRANWISELDEDLWEGPQGRGNHRQDRRGSFRKPYSRGTSSQNCHLSYDKYLSKFTDRCSSKKSAATASH